VLAEDSEATRRTTTPLADQTVVPPVGAADEATRRTTQPDSEATRRTAQVPVDQAAPATDLTPEAATPQSRASRGTARRLAALLLGTKGGWWRRAVGATVVLIIVGVVWNEAHVWSAARELRVQLATQPGGGVDQIWDQYQALARRSVFGLGLAAVRGPLKERLVAQANHVIADYRQDSPTVREAQWRTAVEALTDALRLDPGDRAAAASLQYCEGQLQRITGEARLRRKPQTRETLAAANESLRAAVVRFQDAARLNPRWPDPYLGLARTYIYGLDDLDKANEALNEAERLGYRRGNRELVQLADGYRRRGAHMQAQAEGVRGLAQEADCLKKAADDYQQSIDLYGKAIGFGDAGSYLKQVQKQLDAVKARQAEIGADESGIKGLLKSILGGR
jgi:hypothetical protein